VTFLYIYYRPNKDSGSAIPVQRSDQQTYRAGVEKIFYFLGPQENIENYLQIIKKIDTRIL
jgi:hypothetical protein